MYPIFSKSEMRDLIALHTEVQLIALDASKGIKRVINEVKFKGICEANGWMVTTTKILEKPVLLISNSAGPLLALEFDLPVSPQAKPAEQTEVVQDQPPPEAA